MTDRLAQLYPRHLAATMRAADAALAAGGHDRLLIAAGVERYRFLDDNPYPFAVNPHFKAWVPLTEHAHCWIAYAPGERPVLVYHQPEDYWHLPPSDPEGYWVEHFDLRPVKDATQARAALPRDLSRAAILGEPEAALGDAVPNNPARVLDALHFARTRKSEYEVECMRRASLRGARAHRAAAAAFRDRRSEYEIHLAYCEAAGHAERELPYGNIVALNEHAATLHYQHQARARPAEHRSMLIDAGAQFAGYACDITRTYGNGDATFTALLEATSHAQRALAAKVRPGLDWKRFQDDTHLAVGGVLEQLGVVRLPAAEQFERRITDVFYPHGVGHYIGLQVHDVGGFQKDASGATIPRPERHPYLRCTRVLEAGNAITVEPGIYFIESLLAGLKSGPHAEHVDWKQVEHLARFGGVRIEDDVVVRESGEPENLTRDAFRALAA